MEESKINKYIWNKNDVEWLIFGGSEIPAQKNENQSSKETSPLPEKVVDNLSDTIKNNTLDIDAAVYRLCCFPGIKDNDIFIDKKFVSGTLIRSQLVKWISYLEELDNSRLQDLTIAVINVPKGTNALIPSLVTGELKEEGEIILEKNTVFCITGLGNRVKVNEREFPVIQLIPGYETQEDTYKQFDKDPGITIKKIKAYENDN